MKALRIISHNHIGNFWCRGCKKASNTVVKVGNKSYCDSCVPEQYKDKLVTVNQNREIE